jgi:hypothetical protein
MVDIKKLKDDYFDPKIQYIKKGECSGLSSNSANFRKLFENVAVPGSEIISIMELELYMNLYRQIPEIPLSKFIKSVNFNPSEKDIDLLEQKYPKTYGSPKTKQKTETLKEKKKWSFKYDLGSCLKVGLKKTKGELYCYISPSEFPEKYNLTYAIIKNGITEYHDSTLVDMTEYQCQHTFMPLIILDYDKIFPNFVDQKLIDDDKLKDVLLSRIDEKHIYLFSFD